MQAMHPHKWRYVVVRQTAGLGGGGGGGETKIHRVVHIKTNSGVATRMYVRT